MRIGILTFHYTNNYGAVLQTLALQTYLTNIGHDVKIIDYRPSYLIRTLHYFPQKNYVKKNLLHKLAYLIYYYLALPNRIKRIKRFKSFISSRYQLTNTCNSINSIPQNLDLYILGSDQIWNYQITENQPDNVFWGEFKKDLKTKIATYAASFGDADLNKISDYIKKYSDNFYSISLREEKNKSLLESLTKKKIDIVLDPTLLLDKSYWENFAAETIKKKYVLIFEISYFEGTEKLAHEIADKIEAKVIRITTKPDWRFSNKYVQYATPEEFVGLFKNASYVVTSSFHGTVFSIMFNRPFATFSASDDSRISSLLDKLKLSERAINNSDYDLNNLITQPTNWKEVNSLLNIEKKKSYEYIDKSILSKNNY